MLYDLAPTVELKLHDNRICFRCGAKQGRCQHTRGQVHEGILRTRHESGYHRKVDWHSWNRDDDSVLLDLLNQGKTYGQIADLLNLSRNAVSGRVSRMRRANGR